MTWEEAFKLTGDASVRCRDGAVGLVIRWDESGQRLGIQVPGEPTIRYVPVGRLLHLGGGAVVESSDHRSSPNNSWHEGPPGRI